eukprot:8213935-Pyramimonas_sp.AAC.1
MSSDTARGAARREEGGGQLRAISHEEIMRKFRDLRGCASASCYFCCVSGLAWADQVWRASV